MKSEGNLTREWLEQNPIPLDVRIRVTTQMAFIDLITELGYREDKSWGPDEDETLNKLMKLANEYAKDVLKELEEYNNEHTKS
jgi:hypothetical protein